MRALPSAVRGPVDSPPWKRQRSLPGSTRTAHGCPWRFWAPHRGRSFRLSGVPSPARPIARMATQEAPRPQTWSTQVVLCRGQATKPYSCQVRHASRGIELPGGGPASITRLSSAARAASAAFSDGLPLQERISKLASRLLVLGLRSRSFSTNRRRPSDGCPRDVCYGLRRSASQAA